MKGESRKQNYKKSRKRPPLIQRIKVPLFVLAGLLLVSAGAYGLQKMLPAQTGVTDPAEISTEAQTSSEETTPPAGTSSEDPGSPTETETPAETARSSEAESTRETIPEPEPVRALWNEVHPASTGDFVIDDPNAEDAKVLFNLPSGLYSDTISVEILLAPELEGKASVYYTLNGGDPSQSGTQYTGPLSFTVGTDELKVVPLKIEVRIPDGENITDRRTYVLCRDYSFYEGLGVASLTATQDTLYGSWGIMNEENLQKELVRTGEISYLNADGTMEFEDTVGIKLSGKTSLTFDEKSFKLYAQEEYGGDGAIEFYADRVTEDTQKFHYVSRLKSVRLRSGSQDREMGNLRSGLAAAVLDEYGWTGAAPSNRCLLFLNGEFYSICDLQPTFVNSYLGNRFDIDDNDLIQRVKGRERTVLGAEGANIIGLFYNLYSEEGRAALEAVVDVDDMLTYYALHIVMNDSDFPQNNYEMWRYTGEPDPDNPYTDGRYRFLTYDFDYNWAMYMETFANMLNSVSMGENSVFPKLLEVKEYRDKFLTLVCDMRNTTFRTEHVLELKEKQKAMIYHVQWRYYNSEFMNNTNTFLDRLDTGIRRIDSLVPGTIGNYLGIWSQYSMNLYVPAGGKVSWIGHEVYAGTSYSCDYYKDASFVMTAEPYPGYIINGWMVNGQLMEGDSLTVSAELLQGEAVQIELLTERDEKKDPLIISELSAEGSDDWVRLVNTGQESLILKEYALSNDPADPDMCFLPDITLGAGESLILYGKKHTDFEGWQLSFKLKKNQTLCLSRGKIILDSVKIPDMYAEESYGRWDNSSTWVYFKQK
ncbi:MAG: CotH kinase family protein [Lachnospiraceae bacterium]|nr:CotH kinase family protein [Lachnospiraceae bacterium]